MQRDKDTGSLPKEVTVHRDEYLDDSICVLSKLLQLKKSAWKSCKINNSYMVCRNRNLSQCY